MRESELWAAYGMPKEPVDVALNRCATRGCPAYVLSNVDKFCDRCSEKRRKKVKT